MSSAFDSVDIADAFHTLAKRQRSERGRLLANSPKAAADVIGQVMARRGYGRLQSAGELEDAWRKAAGTLAASTRVGKLRRGVLEIFVNNSVLLTELSFARSELLARLGELVPERKIRDLKLRSINW